MASVSFRGSAERIPFNPLRAPDTSDQLRQQLNQQMSWRREDQQMILQNRRDIAESMRDQNRIDQQARLQDLENLSQFSRSLTQVVTGIKTARDEAAAEAGLLMAYEDGLPIDRQRAYDEQVAAFEQQSQQVDGVAEQLAREGNPPEIVDRIKGLSGKKRFGYMKGLAIMAGLNWQGYLENALANDNETMIEVEGLDPFTPSQVDDRAKLVAATAFLRSKYIRENNLLDAAPELLNKYAFEQMRSGEARVIAERTQVFNIQKGAEQLDELEGQLTAGLRLPGGAGEAFNQFITSGASIVGPKGLPLGKGGARDRAIALIQRLGQAGFEGGLPEDVITQIQNTPIPGGGQTWGEKFPSLFVTLPDEIRKGKEDDLNSAEREEARNEKEYVEDLVQLGEQKGGYTDQEKEEIRKEFALRGKPLPPELDNLLTRVQREDKAAKEYIEQKLAYGQMTLKELMSSGFSTNIINEYKGKVKDQENTILNSDAFKAQENSLKAQLRSVLVGSQTDRTPHWTLGLAEARVRQLLLSGIQELSGGGMPSSQAVEQAAKQVRTLIDNGKQLGTGEFALVMANGVPAPNGGFKRFQGGANQQAIEQAKQQFNRLRQGARNVTSQLLLTEPEIRQLEQIRSNPSLPMPNSVLWLKSQSRNLSEWDIADAQLALAGKPPLTRPPQQVFGEQSDLRLRQLLLRFPTQNRTNTAFRGMPWSAMKVPNGWGVHVEKAAQQYGIDPSLLAGLLAHESAGWKANAVSKSGAVGLAQIMDNTLQDAGITAQERLDPVKSIYAAARIFSKRLQAVNGDTILALRAYNMGLAGALRNPGGYRGDRESIDYPSKVLKAASVYGYGFRDSVSPYRNPTSMNPMLLSKIQVTSSMGMRDGRPHQGVDYGTAQGSRLSFTQPVRLIDMGEDPGGWGYFMKFQLPDGRVVLKGHLSQIPKGFKVGQRIPPNKGVALTGGDPGTPGAGRSTGPHLHLEEWDSSGRRVDPSRSGGAAEIIQLG